MRCYCAGMDPHCPICGGSGSRKDCVCGGLQWIAVVGSDRTQFSAKPCPRCSYMAARRVKVGLGLSDEMKGWTFGAMTQQHPQLLAAAKIIQDVLSLKRGWIVMTAHPGPGKSWLLASAVNQSVASGIPATYCQYTQLMTEFIDARMGRHRLLYAALMRQLTGIPVLALDEFGEGNITDFQWAATRELLVNRSDTAGWIPTLFATNKEPKFLAQKAPWLYDRFMDSDVHRINLTEVPSLRRS